MKSNNTSKSLIGAGILTAIASSLCCITPILALVAGSSGMASSFSWIAPARPYLISFTFLVLAYAWWQQLKPIKPKNSTTDDCGCEEESDKKSFLQTKNFLGIVSTFVIVMTAFPYFSEVFYSENNKEIFVLENGNSSQIRVTIEGMTCDACEQHVNHAVYQLYGIISVNTSYSIGISVVEFDQSLLSIKEIEKAVNSTGYVAIKTELK